MKTLKIGATVALLGTLTLGMAEANLDQRITLIQNAEGANRVALVNEFKTTLLTLNAQERANAIAQMRATVHTNVHGTHNLAKETAQTRLQMHLTQSQENANMQSDQQMSQNHAAAGAVQETISNNVFGVQQDVHDSVQQGIQGALDTHGTVHQGVHDSVQQGVQGALDTHGTVQQGVHDSVQQGIQGAIDTHDAVHQGVQGAVQQGVQDTHGAVQQGAQDTHGAVQQGAQDTHGAVQSEQNQLPNIGL